MNVLSDLVIVDEIQYNFQIPIIWGYKFGFVHTPFRVVECSIQEIPFNKSKIYEEYR